MNGAPRKPGICFVIPSLNPGGTERQLLYLIEGLRTTHDCTVVCTREAGAWADIARQSGATIYELKTWGGWDPRIGMRIRKVLRECKPDIVHTFMFGFDLPINRVARAEDVPVIVSSRRELAAWMKPRHLRRQCAANELADCTVANSHAAAQFAAKLEGLDAARIRVIHNGIDAGALAAQVKPVELALPANARIVGMVANFSPVKDHALFVEAASRLASTRSDVHFLLVGSGGLRRNIEGTIQKHGMQSLFNIISTSNECASLLARMDVCVCTSLREGFPNVILEAMALQRPVVATAVGGIPEIIEDGVTGLLVRSRNPRDFASAIARVLGDPALAALLASNAVARVCTSFPIAAMVESHRALYTELLANPGNRA
ncbi:MAG: glycosyltransferase [Candidatus Hydrogenedentes bacterium]|nr:glycosyltransferase [Candidatus Hydrogenedentota bacterium]